MKNLDLYIHKCKRGGGSNFGKDNFLNISGISQWHIAGLGAVWSGIRVPAGAGNFSVHHRVQTGSGSLQPPLQWVPGALSSGLKRPRREADHSSHLVPRSIRLHGVVLSLKKSTGTTLSLLFNILKHCRPKQKCLFAVCLLAIFSAVTIR
jgi:hypothetical protein